jgi:hypothetical protein
MMNNKRLIELADKAGFLTENGKFYADSFDAINDEVEVFAELIIKEVLAVQEQLIAEGHNAWHLNKPTREHFGVE